MGSSEWEKRVIEKQQKSKGKLKRGELWRMLTP
jgi:hypothetical protein